MKRTAATATTMAVPLAMTILVTFGRGDKFAIGNTSEQPEIMANTPSSNPVHHLDGTGEHNTPSSNSNNSNTRSIR
eukprot:scaffold49775_cov71-Attheya_sp.AAC.3